MVCALCKWTIISIIIIIIIISGGGGSGGGGGGGIRIWSPSLVKTPPNRS